MSVLVACEESQVVTKALRAVGVNAFSCDLLLPSGGHPEWHIQGDVLRIIDDGWRAVLAFPPCTHLASSGAAHFAKKRANGEQAAAAAFFMRMVDCSGVRCSYKVPCPAALLSYPPPLIGG